MISPADILVVEDDADMAELLVEALGEATGLKVSSASDGEAALLALDGAPRLPRVLVLDLRMKPMDGQAVLEFLRVTPRYRALPVIVMTGSDEPADRILPVIAFLRKPLETEHLIAIVRKALDTPIGAG